MKVVSWMRRHPWTGWYIATVVTLDLILQILESSGTL